MNIKFPAMIRLLSVLFIPFLFFLLCLRLKLATGPFYLGPNNDPSYLYLMNSLYILDGLAPGFVQHPGTTLQILGALVIKVLYLPSAFPVLVENVFRHPEWSLHGIYYAVLAINTVSLAGLGWYTARKTNDLFLGALAQSSVFFVVNWNTQGVLSGDIPVAANVNAENLLIGITNVYVLLLVKLYFDQHKDPALPLYKLAAVMGLVAATGMATKVLFAPWVVAPLLLLTKWKERGIFTGAFLAGFALWIIPMLRNFPKFSSWVVEGIMRSGLCGTGQSGLDVQALAQALIRLTHQNILFFSVVAVFGIGVVISYISKNKSFPVNALARRYLAVLCITVFMSLLMLAKQPYAHYIVPTLNFFGVICLFVYLTWELKRAKAVFIVCLAVGIAAGAFLSLHSAGKLGRINKDIYDFSQKVYRDHNDCTVCSYYRSSSPAFALQFGDDNQGYKAYIDVLNKVYPNTYFYHYWSRYFHDGRNVVFYEDLLKRSPCVLLYGSKLGGQFNEGFIKGHQISSAQSEALYVIDQLTVVEALQFFMLAKHYESLQRYPEAYAAAQKAKELGFRDIDPYRDSLLKMIMGDPSKP